MVYVRPRYIEARKKDPTLSFFELARRSLFNNVNVPMSMMPSRTSGSILRTGISFRSRRGSELSRRGSEPDSRFSMSAEEMREEEKVHEDAAMGGN